MIQLMQHPGGGSSGALNPYRFHYYDLLVHVFVVVLLVSNLVAQKIQLQTAVELHSQIIVLAVTHWVPPSLWREERQILVFKGVAQIVCQNQ